MSSFVLWNMETANSVGVYPTQDAALEIIRRAVQEYGADRVGMYALIGYTGRRKKTIASGTSLLELAERLVPA